MMGAIMIQSCTLSERLRYASTIRLWKRQVGADWDSQEEEWDLVGEGANIPVRVGLEQMQKLMWGMDSTHFNYLALGSGSQEPSYMDTALQTELDRLAFTGKTVTDNQAVIKVYFAPDHGNGDISEWGIFNNSSGPTMLNRGLVTPTVTKTDTEEMIAEVVVNVSGT